MHNTSWNGSFFDECRQIFTIVANDVNWAFDVDDSLLRFLLFLLWSWIFLLCNWNFILGNIAKLLMQTHDWIEVIFILYQLLVLSLFLVFLRRVFFGISM